MRLIGLSIFFGIIGFLLASLLGIDGSKINGQFIFTMWLIGFLSPSIYVLDKLYQKSKDKES
jgi:hypothetical protein